MNEETVTLSKSEFAELLGRVSNLEKPDVMNNVQTCNVCGDVVEGRCVKHPNDVTNHVAVDRLGRQTLLKQT